MMHPRYADVFFFGIITSFLFGILLGSEFFVPVPIYIFVLISAFSFCVFLYKTKKVYALFVLLFSCCFLLGIIRFEIKDTKLNEQYSSFQEQTTYEGVVVSPPEYPGNYQRLTVRIDSISAPTKILVTTELYPKFYIGDRVSLKGTVKNPENFIGDSGKEFNYIEYLANKNILFTMSFAEVSLLESKSSRNLQRFLIHIKDSFVASIQRVIREPESGLLGGILLGVKDGLHGSIEENFIKTGTIHIVVLSGYNITIVSEAIVKTLQKIIPERLALSFGAFGIVLFGLLTGGSTTTVRAIVMGLLGLVARVTQRNYDILRALFFAGFVMVCINPFLLVYDISFQLSFLATLGLILVTPLVEKWKFVQFFPERFALREIFASTLATQIAVLPFLLYKIGTLSIVAPLVNILILPLVPFAMGIGALASFVELFHVGSNPISWLSFALLHYIISIVNWFGGLSWSSISISHTPLFFVFFIYAVIVIWIVRNKKTVLRF